MAVDHDARRQHILKVSLRLFARLGYQAVTLTKIADECGYPRTMLYRYFSRKQEIFKYTVTLVTQELAAKYADIEQTPESTIEKIGCVMTYVIDSVFAHRMLLGVILDYVISFQRGPRSPRRTIARHSYGLRALLHRLILKGIHNGELRQMSVGNAVNLLYTQVESAILRITITDSANRKEIDATIHGILSWMRAP